MKCISHCLCNSPEFKPKQQSLDLCLFSYSGVTSFSSSLLTPPTCCIFMEVIPHSFLQKSLLKVSPWELKLKYHLESILISIAKLGTQKTIQPMKIVFTITMIEKCILNVYWPTIHTLMTLNSISPFLDNPFS